MPYIGAGIQRFNTADGLTVNGNAEVTGTSALTGAVTASGGATLSSSSSGEFNALTISQADNTSGNESRISFKRTTDAGSDREVAAIVADRVGGNDTALVFETNTDGSDGATETVRIDHDGKVGIGTSTPSSYSGNLAVVDSAVGSIAISGGTDANQGSLVRFQKGTTDKAFIGMHSSVTGGGSTSDGLTINSTTATSMRFFNNGSERMRINSAGQIATGNATVDSSRCNSGTLVVNAATSGSSETQVQIRAPQNTDSTVRNYVLFYRNDGTIVGNIGCNNSSTAYNTSSDYRLKENVADMTGAIARVKQLSPKRFSWIADELDAANVDGFLAHEAQTVVPEAVHGTHNQVEVWVEPEVDDDGNIISGEALPDGVSAGDNKLDEDGNTIPVYQGIDQSKMVPLLTGALREAIAKIETLETEMTALKARVTALEDA